nr:immunoglobulin light chain junction region [Macaca mulatta]
CQRHGNWPQLTC